MRVCGVESLGTGGADVDATEKFRSPSFEDRRLGDSPPLPAPRDDVDDFVAGSGCEGGASDLSTGFGGGGGGSSVAERMMASMGYKEGTGLGKDEQGRAKAVEDHGNMGTLGLGFRKALVNGPLLTTGLLVTVQTFGNLKRYDSPLQDFKRPFKRPC